MKCLPLALLFCSLWFGLWGEGGRVRSQTGQGGGNTKRKARGPVKLTEEALRIHRAALLIDGHNDLPWQFRDQGDLSFRKLDIRKVQKTLHTDLPRLRQGGVGAQFWAAYVPASTRKTGEAVR